MEESSMGNSLCYRTHDMAKWMPGVSNARCIPSDACKHAWLQSTARELSGPRRARTLPPTEIRIGRRRVRECRGAVGAVGTVCGGGCAVVRCASVEVL